VRIIILRKTGFITSFHLIGHRIGKNEKAIIVGYTIIKNNKLYLKYADVLQHIFYANCVLYQIIYLTFTYIENSFIVRNRTKCGATEKYVHVIYATYEIFLNKDILL